MRRAFKSSIVDATDDKTVINTAEGLWMVVDEAIDLLEPIDLEGVMPRQLVMALDELLTEQEEQDGRDRR